MHCPWLTSGAWTSRRGENDWRQPTAPPLRTACPPIGLEHIDMIKRISAVLLLLTGAGPSPAIAQTTQLNADGVTRANIGGTLVDQQGNTAIAGANVALFRGNAAVGRRQSLRGHPGPQAERDADAA